MSNGRRALTSSGRVSTFDGERISVWLASTVLAIVLSFLTAGAVTGALLSYRAGTSAKHATNMSDAFEEARYAVGAEESLERKYRLEPSPDVRARHGAAAGSLLASLGGARELGADPALIDGMFAKHKGYLLAISRMFAAIDAGDRGLADQIDNDEVDPTFDEIETGVLTAAASYRAAALKDLTDLADIQSMVLIATPAVFIPGVAIVILFWSLLGRSRRQAEDSLRRLATQFQRLEQSETSLAGRNVDLERSRTQLESQTVELSRAKDAAEAASAAKSEFLAAMSHELRTPLNAVIGFSEIIRGEAMGAGVADCYRDYANDIHNSGKHLLAIVNDILDMARSQAGSLQFEARPVDVAVLIDWVKRIIAPRALSGGVELRIDVADGLVVKGDEDKLRQALLNLAHNAVKFTPAGGTVTLACHAIDAAARLQVIDSGVGIAAGDISAALTPFRQIDGALHRKYEGAGLGLPLAKRYVEGQGGTLTIESSVGWGTIVTVTMPLLPATLHAVSSLER